jgi:hypothetical protein
MILSQTDAILLEEIEEIYGFTAVQRGEEIRRSNIVSSIFSDENLQENRIKMLMRRVQYAEPIIHHSRLPAPAPSDETGMRNPAT